MLFSLKNQAAKLPHREIFHKRFLQKSFTRVFPRRVRSSSQAAPPANTVPVPPVDCQPGSCKIPRSERQISVSSAPSAVHSVFKTGLEAGGQVQPDGRKKRTTDFTDDTDEAKNRRPVPFVSLPSQSRGTSFWKSGFCVPKGELFDPVPRAGPTPRWLAWQRAKSED
jgi:hypothetical protein